MSWSVIVCAKKRDERCAKVSNYRDEISDPVLIYISTYFLFSFIGRKVRKEKITFRSIVAVKMQIDQTIEN